MLPLCPRGLYFENCDYMLPLELAISRIYEEGPAGSGDVKNKNASNVDDLELAKQLQNFIELEDAPLKRKLTNPMAPGGYYTKPKKREHLYSLASYSR